MRTQPPHFRLARRRRLAAFLVISAAIATLATVLNLCHVGLLPPSIQPRDLQQAAATTRAVVVTHPSKALTTSADFEGLAKRANLVANMMSTPPVLKGLGPLAGVDPSQIAAETEITIGVPEAFSEPDSERRANQILQSHDPYRLEVQPRPGEPIIDIYTLAPTTEEALRLADESIVATNRDLRALAHAPGIDNPEPVSLVQLGSARGGTVESTGVLEIAALTFVTAFAISFGLLLLVAEARRGWLRGGRVAAAGHIQPPPRRARDDWPHTTRILPWLIAAFIAMLWLVPINAITIEASLPIDLKLDRVVLPVIVVFWLLSLTAGGRGAPRWRFTKVHAAVAGFVAVAFLSVVLNATYLNHTLELGVAIKKLVLLGAFFSIFLIVASSIRPTEVRPFLTFMLAMSVLCALGILWEYRFDTNLFYSWSSKLLPGIFHVAAVNTSGYDEIGRRAVIGPADVSLEAVAMLSMAFPIGLVRLMGSRETRERIFYALAVCILLGAMIATYRKSALLAPLTVVLVLIAFRRREMLRLAPLGIASLLAVPILAPNALGAIVNQFRPTRLGVSTVSDRVSDYDAIRPDLLSHPVFGRGYGSYEHTSYRTLDNDLLMRVVETGLIGLTAFIVMLIAIVVIAAPIIRARHREWAGPALAVAAATAAFLVLSVLFDIMSFPHTPYLLMVLLGLFAVVARAATGEAGAQGPTAHEALAPPEPAQVEDDERAAVLA